MKITILLPSSLSMAAFSWRYARNGYRFCIMLCISGIEGECKMNKVPNDSIVVVDISSEAIEIVASNRELIDKMKILGFIHCNESLLFYFGNEGEKKKAIKILINENALFSFDYGWYPSEVMAHYIENGIYFGPYKVISWRDENTYHIEER